MRGWLLRLYPRSWRRRYGDEFAALLEHYPLTPLVVLDVVRGALDAHWSLLGAELTPLDSAAQQRAVKRKALLLGLVVFIGGWLVRWLASPATHRPQVVSAAWHSIVYIGVVAVLVYGVPAVRRRLALRRTRVVRR